MRRRMIAVGLATLVVAASVVPASARADDTGGIRGTVTSALTGAPVPRAIVGVFADHNSRAIRYVRTRADGTFVFTALAARSYEVCVDVAHYPVDDPYGFGFLSRCFADAAWHPGGQFDQVPSDATEVDLSGGGVATGVDIALPPGAVVSGQVIDASTGNPLEGVDVHLSGTGAYANATTGSDGRYTMSAVEPGGYRLCWFTERVAVQAVDVSPTGYLDQCYYRVRTVFDADPGEAAVEIDLAGGQTYGYSTALRRAAGIVGTVVDHRDGSPIAGIAVRLASDPRTTRRAVTAADGVYTIRGLDRPDGTEVCFASDQDVTYPGSRTAYVATCTDVGAVRFGRFVAGDAALDPAGRIVGQIRIQGSGYQALALVFDPVTGVVAGAAHAADNGRYAVTGLAPNPTGYVACAYDFYVRSRCFDGAKWGGPGKPLPADAELIPVSSGGTARADIVLPGR